MDLPTEIEAVWWPRFTALIPQFLAWERERAYNVQTRFAEISSDKREVEGLGVTLSGRADRIDLMRDGTAEIIDYKTGSTPSPKQAHVLLSPQRRWKPRFWCAAHSANWARSALRTSPMSVSRRAARSSRNPSSRSDDRHRRKPPRRLARILAAAGAIAGRISEAGKRVSVARIAVP